jgi:hypothetical protein
VALLSVFGVFAAAEDAGPAVAPGAGDLAVGSVTTASVPGPSEIRPRILGGFDVRTRVRLTVALRLADERLRNLPACSSLFDDLGADGLTRLRATRYQSVADVGGERVCGRGLGAAAFTTVGNLRTVICPGFDRLGSDEAAVIVLHEALHSAGLGEWPLDPDGQNGGEINRMVRLACGL